MSTALIGKTAPKLGAAKGGAGAKASGAFGSMLPMLKKLSAAGLPSYGVVAAQHDELTPSVGAVDDIVVDGKATGKGAYTIFYKS